MSELICAHCNAPVHLTIWDLIPSRFPETYFCSVCKAGNMQSRRTILLALAPSLTLSLSSALSARLLLASWWAIPAILAAYIVGLPIGAWLARRYGRLVKPHKPWP